VETTEVSSGAALDPLLGRLLDGRYRIEQAIARGGMATVYVATDTRLDRLVALKVMRPALAEDPDFVERFGREARAAARLSSPAVVAVHDTGTDPATGTAYLVMEYLAGGTLRDLMHERGAVPPARALQLFEPVLRALAAAHAANLIHRDVKPENVLLADDGRIKVADFGLARAVETSNFTATTGLLIGTVAYLAPEQVEHGVADPRTDVYAAGIMLWEMLTGFAPYRSDSPLTVAYRHVNEDVPPPGAVADGIPAALDDLVVRATRRDPAARPVDAGAFLAEVRAVRGDLPPPPEETLVLPRASLPPVVAAQVRTPPALPAQAPAGPPVRAAGSTRVGPATPPPVRTADDAPPAPARPRRSRQGLVWSLVVALLAAAALTGGWYLGSGRYTEMPPVLGLDQAAASAQLELAGLQVALAPEEFSEDMPAGTVLDQDPAPNSRVRKTGTVTLVLSKGPDRRPVPDVAGKDRAAAEAALGEVGLRVGEVPEEFSDRPKGTVLRTDPPAGERLRPDSAVALVVSKGLEMLPVPDVRGRSQADAGKRLKAAGFVSSVSEVFSESASKGVVVGQEPSGRSAPRGATVKLTVSKGPELLTIPDLGGKPRDEAEAALEALGLQPRVVAIPGPGTVRSSQPAAGEKVRRGSTVTLFVF
jgi:beta-lactam-binding protein with PASTA domain/serine/threonine protein kinase